MSAAPPPSSEDAGRGEQTEEEDEENDEITNMIGGCTYTDFRDKWSVFFK